LDRRLCPVGQPARKTYRRPVRVGLHAADRTSRRTCRACASALCWTTTVRGTEVVFMLLAVPRAGRADWPGCPHVTPFSRNPFVKKKEPRRMMPPGLQQNSPDPPAVGWGIG
jgi:hypothetical protein